MPIRIFTDQMGNQLQLEGVPKRIVSLVPSQTELLHDLGLEEEVVGITKFCVYPKKWFESKKKIGGTKNFHLDWIASLEPDLIIGNKEENVKEKIEALQADFPVWMSDVRTFADALEMIREVADLVGKRPEGERLVAQIGGAFSDLQKNVLENKRLKVLYLIWRKPYMAASQNTFIDEMLSICGFENVLKEQLRYPEVSIEDLRIFAPDLVLLSSEPYPFQTKHVAELQVILPNSAIELVNGEFFSWYGSRLLKAASYLRKLITRI